MVDLVVSLDRLGAALAIANKETERRVSRALKAAARSYVDAAAAGTPADTTEARSNWQCGINTAPSSVLPPAVRQDNAGIDEIASLTVVNRRANGVVRRWKPLEGEEFFIANNWPLIEELNNGTISRQGSHFVEQADAAAVVTLNQILNAAGNLSGADD